jgi:hypothetical protein
MQLNDTVVDCEECRIQVQLVSTGRGYEEGGCDRSIEITVSYLLSCSEYGCKKLGQGHARV